MKNKKSKAIREIFQWISFVLKNKNAVRITGELKKVKAVLMLANHGISKLSTRDDIYAKRIKEFNQAMIDISKSKWYAAQAMDTNSKSEWKRSFEKLKSSSWMAEELCRLLNSGSKEGIKFEESRLSNNDTEILFADDVPMLPEINPVVILKGSDFDMGYQYAQQLIKIFGSWIFDRKSKQKFTGDDIKELRKWEGQLKIYAPEIIEMCKGWEKGAEDMGVKLTYDAVLDIWAGHKPPVTDYFGLSSGPPKEIPRPACSGTAAWGRATKDGKLVTGSSGDHDCTFMVTIVAFPETGNNFIYTPFAANGYITNLGDYHMFGHPGMNSKGVAYVEHGGDPKMVEPKKYWGYGLKKGPSVFHTLRFANSAKEARDMELSYPVGDIGRGGFCNVGGFYADSTYGYVMESHVDPLIIREAGVMGETDFLYANNGAIHPEVNKAEWMQKDRENWAWDEHGGWYPVKFSYLKKFGVDSMDNLLAKAMRFGYLNSYRRNLYMYDMLSKGMGNIDMEYMKMMFRKSGTLPEGSWEDISNEYKKTGKWGECSIGHSSNAVVAVMKPDNGDDGLYSLCIGTAARGLTPVTPEWNNPIFNETNAFFEIKLSSSPLGVCEYARKKAEEYMNSARIEFEKLDKACQIYEMLKNLMDTARQEFGTGAVYEGRAKASSGNESVYNWSKSVRAFTKAQVRALQVCQALVTPTSCFEEMK